MLNIIRGLIENDENKEAIKHLIREEYHQENVYKSRFYKFYFDEKTTTPRYIQVLESSISNYYDMQDCNDEEMNYFYLENDGSFHKVSASGPLDNAPNAGELDEFYQENPTTMFTRPGNLIANNKIVGSVSYSDH